MNTYTWLCVAVTACGLSFLLGAWAMKRHLTQLRKRG
jgi:hypothetical protein